MSSIKSNYNLNSFNSSELLATSLASNISLILQKSIKDNGSATLLVSGGNTPKLFFERLSLCALAWEKVTIGLIDERCVEVSNKDSNEKLVKTFLLQNNAKKANFVGMYNENSSLEKSNLEILNNDYKKVFNKADVAVLGMGTDGHTASIFPELDDLNEVYKSLDFCVKTKPKNAPFERLTLTLNSILDCKNIFLHIEGKQKKEIFDKACQNDDNYPISKVLFNNKKTVEVYSYE